MQKGQVRPSFCEQKEAIVREIENPEVRVERSVCLWPPKKRVMPAKAGIHDFLAAPRTSAFLSLTVKSWMPAFAGMTGEGAGGGGRNPLFRVFKASRL
jgi:hypothetical protein